MGSIIYQKHKNSFFKYLITKLQKKYSLSNFNEKSFLVNYNNKSDLSVMIFFFYEKSDIIYFTNYYINKFKIIVCSNDSEILDDLKKFEGIQLINTYTSKDLIYKQVINYIKILKSIK